MPFINDKSDEQDLQMSAGDPSKDYFSNKRPEMLDIVPKDIRNVLEVGCGAGRFDADA